MHPDNQNHYPQPEHQDSHLQNNTGSSGDVNPMAIAGFVSTFAFFPVGFVLSIIALKQIKRTHEKGRELALAGAIISGFCLLAIPVGVILALTINTPPEKTWDPNNDSSLSSPAKARNAEREADIQVIYLELESAYERTAYYPTLNQLNDELWRHQYMPDLDVEALFDPGTESASLSATPAANTYAYEVFPYGCDNAELFCDRYVLTATFDGGGTYAKTSLDHY